MEDIEIAKNADIQNINEIAKKINISEEYLEQYGKYKAKIDLKLLKDLEQKKDGKLVFVTDGDYNFTDEQKAWIEEALK